MRVQKRHNTVSLVEQLKFVHAAAFRLWNGFVEQFANIDHNFRLGGVVDIEQTKLPLSDVANNTIFVQPRLCERHNGGEKRRTRRYCLSPLAESSECTCVVTVPVGFGRLRTCDRTVLAVIVRKKRLRRIRMAKIV